VVRERPRSAPRVSAGRAGRRPGLLGGLLLRSLLTTGDLAGVPTPAIVSTARRTGDLRRGVAQRRTHLLDIQFDGRTPLALARLEAPLTEVALRNHAHALRHGTRDVLGEVAPDAGAQEQGFAVLPLTRRAVEHARGRSDREVRHGDP